MSQKAIRNEWLLNTKLVVKPDQLIKRRGKSGLIGLNMTFPEVCSWLEKYRNKEITVGLTTGVLDTFIIEEFVPHPQQDEYYICIYSTRHVDTILFHHEGGVDIGDVNSKAVSFDAPLQGTLDLAAVESALLQKVPAARKPVVLSFIASLFKVYQKLHFTYLEINPLVFIDDPTGTQGGPKLSILDLAAKLDETATFLVGKQWCQATGHREMVFPAPFGRSMTKEEKYISDLDAKTGASLKLTVLNPKGRVWTLVAGGGASVCFADAITSIPGYAGELANYGEYSGAPTTADTYNYTKTILELLTHPNNQVPNTPPKVLLIGGAIANFTDVAATFKGIINALDAHKAKLIEQKVAIFCRRGGPNFQEGLRLLRTEGSRMGLDILVFGPEVALTSIVTMALKTAKGGNLGLGEDAHRGTNATIITSNGANGPVGVIHDEQVQQKMPTELVYERKYVSPQQIPTTALTSSSITTTGFANPEGLTADSNNPDIISLNGFKVNKKTFPNIKILSAPPLPTLPDEHFSPLFTPQTKSIVYGLQVGAVQNMLDFDYISGREPSVKAIVYPFNGNHYQKFFWNTKEILIPCLTSLSDAVTKYPDVSCIVNFSSFRSVFDTCTEVLQYSNQIKTLAVIAEGVPERLTRLLIKKCDEKKVTFIGPATVGGIKPGCFRIGNAGGMLDNIISSKLYRPGSVAYVSKSGGLSNELNNLIAQNTNGVYEGLAIGGDRHPGSSFLPHLMRFEQDPMVKMIVLIGELGGTEELAVCELLKTKKITKPLIAWCIGTAADTFTYDIQFGHAGACANGDMETASYKNKELAAAGAIVPENFNFLGLELNRVYAQLVEAGTIPLWEEAPPPSIPCDFKWAAKLGLIRKPTSFISTISDERGEELTYAGVKISDIVSNPDFGGLGGVIGLLWFKRQLPPYFSKFIEIVLCLVADHGPSVAGAHVAITTARAGRDLVSCLSAGLLTIGSRFGGALDEAGRQFYAAVYVDNHSPEEFIQSMQKKKTLISGIGHKIKTLENPDSRVVEIKKFLNDHITTPFPHIKTPVLDFALQVELLTTRKKSNLILNVDGIIACLMVDLWKAHPDLFNDEEIEQMMSFGVLNAFFILGRSIGLMGHVFDQSRLKQPLYRHPDDDVLYANTDLL